MSKETSTQIPFKEIYPEVYQFNGDVIIYPQRERQGVVQHPFQAKKIPGKINGLSGFRDLGPVTLYLDGRFWTLPRGSCFGAYAASAKKIRGK